jgi:hypothetical protein
LVLSSGNGILPESAGALSFIAGSDNVVASKHGSGSTKIRRLLRDGHPSLG